MAVASPHLLTGHDVNRLRLKEDLLNIGPLPHYLDFLRGFLSGALGCRGFRVGNRIRGTESDRRNESKRDEKREWMASDFGRDHWWMSRGWFR